MGLQTPTGRRPTPEGDDDTTMAADPAPAPTNRESTPDAPAAAAAVAAARAEAAMRAHAALCTKAGRCRWSLSNPR